MSGASSTDDPILVRITGAVEQPLELTFANLVAIDAQHQIEDVSQLIPQREGGAVRLAGILELVRPQASADYLGLHASADDFHASIPLQEVRDRGLVLYKKNDQPLSLKEGGPVRFFIPDHAECHTDEIDECANVKFIDQMELQIGKGFDNRPEDDEEHEQLHERQSQTPPPSS